MQQCSFVMELNEIDEAVSRLSKAGFKPSQCGFVRDALIYGLEPTIQKTEEEWYRFRGIGRSMMPTLRELGMVMSDPWPAHLSVRARTALKKAGVGAEEMSVKDALEKGRICLAKPRNLGITALNELRTWVGLPVLNPYIPGGVQDLRFKLTLARTALESITHDMGAGQNIHNLCAETLTATAP